MQDFLEKLTILSFGELRVNLADSLKCTQAFVNIL